MKKIRCNRQRHRRRSSPSSVSRSCLLLMSLLLSVLCSISVVSSLSMPSLSTRRPLLRVSSLEAAPPGLQEQTESSTRTVGLFNSDLSPDTLDAPVVEDSTGKLPHSDKQLKSIHSNAPAILLKSGPGTGKTYALASRIAHLIQSGSCRPEQMVVLSFTNRDAHTLKERAVQMYKQNTVGNDRNNVTAVSTREIMDRLWSGTIHAFASSIIRTYSRTRRRHFRVINSKEMRARVDKCLRILLEEKHYGSKGRPSLAKLKKIRILHRDALADLRQSRGILIHQVNRCIDLWKDSGVLPPPAVCGLEKVPHNLERKSVRDDCVELSVRLGISQNVARLAIELFPQYQTLHEAHGTVDPSDLAGIATRILKADTRALTAFRTKLKHVILDGYQDVSVTQHDLIRVIVRGVVDEAKQVESLPPVLDQVRPSHPSDGFLCFNVPKLFCGGDSNQSIYGWRGAAPYVSTEGFRRDYPQGIVVPLDRRFRLSDEVWTAANGLIDPERTDKRKVKACSTSPGRWSVQGSDDSDETLRALFSEMASDYDELSSPIRIQGMWDAREEAKYIASTIRKRCKARLKRCSSALGKLTSLSDRSVRIDRDPSDVAVMVRSGKQLALIKEALASVGVPFVVCTSEEDAAPLSRLQVRSNLKLIDMRPVVLMTMHRAKGEEFDDVYLAGWTEGMFPHPTSISANRVDEERRLAYVAITRARQKVVITHSFMDRVLHNGPNLTSKHVTTQVSPSRFLYELCPAAMTSSADTVHNAGNVEKDSRGVPSVVWYRGKGVKECIAGRDVPDYFANSYTVDRSFRPAQSLTEPVDGRTTVETKHDAETHEIANVQQAPDTAFEREQEEGTDTLVDRLTLSDKELLNTVKNGLGDIERKQRGAKGKFKAVFREMLRDRFNLQRGTALVLPEEKESRVKGDEVSYDSLIGIPQERLEKKPLSRATAIELGRYLYYLFLHPFSKSN